ncbi:SAM-dependent methyltransferase [Nannocystis punicea]|uniref:S-adenosyl-L-methionine-dependent methyltransferase n=1 Tax=Nannocystis punicea TaxID=2995304 RepID=A0ABY7H5R1_9BACT|nr:SAM-dependent methyltransferase [Nannocystis poenicansa]WAS94617.1 SAM-dependent methyltransferase [Nannocystis poenicansa]
MLNSVATTGLLVAAMRAEESARADRLFDDPFAAQLAGGAGRAALAAYRSASPLSLPIIEVRTRYYDEALARAWDAGIRQFVVLAAGMDARAYRLSWPADARVFEVDQPDVLAAKAERLGGARSRAARFAVGADLGDDWPAALLAADFDRSQRTAWLVEGLLQYLDASVVAALFARVEQLSAPGSRLLYDVVGRGLLEAPALAPTLRMMRELGAPWVYATDEPGGLIGAHGWDAVVTDPSVLAAEWGRWPFPALPPDAPGVPRGYLVEASKR